MKKGEKRNFTIVFLQALNEEVSEENITKYSKILWHSRTARPTGGLRLSKDGFDLIKPHIHFYKINMKKEIANLSSREFLYLDKFMKCPYYFFLKNMFVTTQKQALEFLLIAGDINKFGLAKTMTKRRLNK